MQYYNSQGDGVAHKDIYTGKGPVRRQQRVCLFSTCVFCLGKNKDPTVLKGAAKEESVVERANECPPPYKITIRFSSVAYFFKNRIII